jgi:methionyl aminopeptidase
MIGLGSPKFKLDPDQWTYRTIDGSISVQVEHTVAVTSNGPLILTTL